MQFAYAKLSAVVQWGVGGACVTLARGEVWYADDPFVLDRSDLFSATPVIVHNTTGREAPPETSLSEAQPRRGRARG